MTKTIEQTISDLLNESEQGPSELSIELRSQMKKKWFQRKDPQAGWSGRDWRF